MITTSDIDGIELCDFEDLYNFTDKFLYNDANLFNSLLEDRSFICNSVSSSACPSITSEASSAADFDFSYNEEDFDLFSFDRMVDLVPEPTNKVNICKNNRIKKKGTLMKKNNVSKNISTSNHKRKWSIFSRKERTQKLKYLIETASEKFGLREQLNVIKIVNPNASLSPSATEFSIDFDLINDENYELMNEYVEKELKRLEDNQKNEENNENSTKKKKHKANQVCSSKRKKIRKSEQKLVSQKANIKNMQKICNQQLKERKSGLFSREQVVAMASLGKLSDDDGDNEEIDILT